MKIDEIPTNDYKPSIYQIGSNLYMVCSSCLAKMNDNEIKIKCSFCKVSHGYLRQSEDGKSYFHPVCLDLSNKQQSHPDLITNSGDCFKCK